MCISTTGMFPSEYDDTTNRVLRTVQAFGVTDEEIQDDQLFLVTMLEQIGIVYGEFQDTIKAMDLAFIGLLYHRHMPFRASEDDDTLVQPRKGPADYTGTLSAVSTALIQQAGIPPQVISQTANDAARLALEHLRKPDSFERDDLTLHTQWIALSVIGLMVHRLMPSTHDNPMKGH